MHCTKGYLVASPPPANPLGRSARFLGAAPAPPRRPRIKRLGDASAS